MPKADHIPNFMVQGNKDRNEFDVIHTDADPTKVISTIHKVERKKPHPLAKRRFEYKVTNQAGITQKNFWTLKSAVHHSITHYQKNGGITEHPMNSVADDINALGHKIWAASEHPAMDDGEQHKILQVAKAHAELANVYNTHYNTRKD